MKIGKVIELNEFLQHLKIVSDRYASQNGRRFVNSLGELWAFISVNFVMAYHMLPTLRSYSKTGHFPVSVNYVVNVIKRKWFKEILSNLQFSNNVEALPQDNPD